METHLTSHVWSFHAVPLLRHNWFNHWPWSWTQSQLLFSLWRSAWCQEFKVPILQSHSCFLFCFLACQTPSWVISSAQTLFRPTMSHLVGMSYQDSPWITKILLLTQKNPKDFRGYIPGNGVKSHPNSLFQGFWDNLPIAWDKGQTKSLLHKPSMSSIRLQALWLQMRVLLLWIPHNF